eukprot:GHVQ01025830.1.p1 GENE.GHVQ01025830.1~~GHVQ01025830.1.p1  ORF type:complete len:660 (-),score=68.04 GHVQ01025830.1:2090-4069(-)
MVKHFVKKKSGDSGGKTESRDRSSEIDRPNPQDTATNSHEYNNTHCQGSSASSSHIHMNQGDNTSTNNAERTSNPLTATSTIDTHWVSSSAACVGTRSCPASVNRTAALVDEVPSEFASTMGETKEENIKSRARVLYLQGSKLESRGKLGEAIEFYSRALKLDPLLDERSMVWDNKDDGFESYEDDVEASGVDDSKIDERNRLGSSDSKQMGRRLLLQQVETSRQNKLDCNRLLEDRLMSEKLSMPKDCVDRDVEKPQAFADRPDPAAGVESGRRIGTQSSGCETSDRPPARGIVVNLGDSRRSIERIPARMKRLHSEGSRPDETQDLLLSLPFEVLKALLLFLDAYSVARVESCCVWLREQLHQDSVVWQNLWYRREGMLHAPTVGLGSWKVLYLQAPRIRFDGVYISKCRYLRRVPDVGNIHLDDKSRVSYHHTPIISVEYYRYLRFLPRANKVLVLRSEVEQKNALRALKHVDSLIYGLPHNRYNATSTTANSGSGSGAAALGIASGEDVAPTWEKLLRLVAVGVYQFDPQNSNCSISYGDDRSQVYQHDFSEQLTRERSCYTARTDYEGAMRDITSSLVDRLLESTDRGPIRHLNCLRLELSHMPHGNWNSRLKCRSFLIVPLGGAFEHEPHQLNVVDDKHFRYKITPFLQLPRD